jgi:hypothetical protein
VISSWEPHNELFDFDGVHLSDEGVDALIQQIIKALKHVPKFLFETDLRMWLNNQ